MTQKREGDPLLVYIGRETNKSLRKGLLSDLRSGLGVFRNELPFEDRHSVHAVPCSKLIIVT